MTRSYLKPWKFLNTEGKLSYGESAQAWNIIWLKRKILDEFPQLKAKRSELCYDMTFVRDYDALIEQIKRFRDDGKPLPLLLWFYEEKKVEE